MADATNRPEGSGEAPTSITTAPDEAPETMPPTTETYHPLSLLSLIGFGLAIAYALLVLVGGLVALLGRVPWLLPLWTFTIPLVVLIVCWAARKSIRDSEGVLSGLAFTTWGMRLTVIVAVTYAAYYSVSFLTIRLQATDYVESLFKQLQQGKVDQAFALAMGIPISGESDLRQTLEARFNSNPGRQGQNLPGPFSRFRQSQFVRYMLMSGGQAKYAPLGVVDWNYENKAYRVILKYLVATPLVEFELLVETVGEDPKPGESKGRQWRVDFTRGALSVDRRTEKLTDRGKELLDKAETARRFVMTWVNRVNNWQWDEAYLETLPPAQRQRRSLVDSVPVAGLAPLVLGDATDRAFLAGKQGLWNRDLMQLNDKVFWASPSLKDDIRRRVGKTFPPVSERQAHTYDFRIPGQLIPIVQERDGELTLLFDLEIRYLNEASQGMDYIVEGQVVVSADSSQVNNSSDPWWIKRIELDSGRSPPTMRKEPGPQGQGGMGPPGPPGPP